MFEGCKSLISIPDISKWNITIYSIFKSESSDDSNNSNNLNINLKEDFLPERVFDLDENSNEHFEYYEQFDNV